MPSPKVIFESDMTHPCFLFNAVHHHRPLNKLVSVTFNPNNETGASSFWLKILLEVGHGTFLSSHLCFLEEREERTRDYEQHSYRGQMLLTYVCFSRGDGWDSQMSLFFIVTEQVLE